MSSTSFDVTEITRTASAISMLAAAAKMTGVVTSVELAGNKSWGSDAIGTAFAGVYQPAAEETMRNVLDVAPHLGEIADKLSASADQYSRTEEDNAQRATGVED